MSTAVFLTHQEGTSMHFSDDLNSATVLQNIRLKARNNEKVIKTEEEMKRMRQDKGRKEKKEQWKVAANSSISKPLCRNSLCLPSPSH